MPNKRDPKKKQLRTWMLEEDLQLIKKEARTRGVLVSEMILDLVKKSARQRHIQKQEK